YLVGHLHGVCVLARPAGPWHDFTEARYVKPRDGAGAHQVVVETKAAFIRKSHAIGRLARSLGPVLELVFLVVPVLALAPEVDLQGRIAATLRVIWISPLAVGGYIGPHPISVVVSKVAVVEDLDLVIDLGQPFPAVQEPDRQVNVLVIAARPGKVVVRGRARGPVTAGELVRARIEGWFRN